MTRLLVLAGLVLVAAWSVRATKPADVSMGRHVQAIVGAPVVAALQAGLRSFGKAAGLLLVVWLAWPLVGPTVSHALSFGLHQAASAAVPDVHVGILDWFKSKGGSR